MLVLTWRCLAILISVVLIGSGPTAVAAAPALAASVAPQAALLPSGAVLVRIKVTCEPGASVLEAFVYVTQAGVESPFAPIPLDCTGRPRAYEVQVPPPPEGAFHPGVARVSGYILLETSQSTSPTRTVKLR
jgi:hypothetical protein